MTDSPIDYSRFLRDALRQVVRRALERLDEIGPTGAVHLLVTFRTSEPGVDLPPELRREFPEKMTIELQHQFWELTTDDDGFSVVLSFSGRRRRLAVPWSAILEFVDPETSFGLSFEAREEDVEEEEDDQAGETAEVLPFAPRRREGD